MQGVERFLEERERKRESDTGVGGWGESKTGQGRATHIFPLLCFYLSSQEMPSTVSMKTLSSSMVKKPSETINKTREQNALLADGDRHISWSLTADYTHYLLFGSSL